MDYEKMLDDILEWSEHQDKFNSLTFIGIKDNYQEYGTFTDLQRRAIENVYFKWKVDKWVENRSSDNCIFERHLQKLLID